MWAQRWQGVPLLLELRAQRLDARRRLGADHRVPSGELLLERRRLALHLGDARVELALQRGRACTLL